jgi:hypothetical protein
MQQTFRYPLLTDERDIQSLECEKQRSIDQRTYIEDKSQDIDIIRQTIDT